MSHLEETQLLPRKKCYLGSRFCCVRDRSSKRVIPTPLKRAMSTCLRLNTLLKSERTEDTLNNKHVWWRCTMSDISDFYTSSITDDVTTLLLSTIQNVSREWDIDNFVAHHLKLASDALESEKARRKTSLFCQNHGSLNPIQFVRAKLLLSEKACAANASNLAAEACSMSVGHFERCFRMSAGMSPHRWITSIRMKKAKQLLIDTSSSITDVARQCGYTEQCHFTRIFTREVGISPGAWRRLLNNLS